MFSVTGRDPVSGQGIEVRIENGLIAGISDCDYQGASWISAGLVDLQVNGFAGYDLNDNQISTKTLLSLAKRLLVAGVTTFLPTVITASFEQIAHSLATIAQARKQNPLLMQMIPAVHLEGPWIAPEDGPRGAHPLAHVRAPDINEFLRWQQCCDSLIGLVTLSVHWPGSREIITQLCQQRVKVAIGHSNASDQQIMAAIDAGASLSTHLGNGAAAILPRHPNLLWTQLAEDRLSASFIADGHHLPAATLKAMLRAKGLQRSVLVSDVVAAGGLQPGVYQQPVGGSVVLREDGRLELQGTAYLAGAALPLNCCVAVAISAAGITLADALQMATQNPADFAGQGGMLAVGKAADLICFDWQAGDTSLNIHTVFKHGERHV